MQILEKSNTKEIKTNAKNDTKIEVLNAKSDTKNRSF